MSLRRDLWLRAGTPSNGVDNGFVTRLRGYSRNDRPGVPRSFGTCLNLCRLRTWRRGRLTGLGGVFSSRCRLGVRRRGPNGKRITSQS